MYDKQEKLTFAIDSHTYLVLVDEKFADRDPPKIPVDKALLDSDRFWKMVIDPVRRRLILTPRDGRNKPLAAYDIATNKWSVLQEKFSEVSCLTYVEALDAMFAIPSSGNDPNLPQSGTPKPRDTILKLDASGKVLKEIRTSSPMDLGDSGLGSTQVVYVDDLLVVLGRPAARPEPRSTGMMYVVDPQTGDVLYSGRQELQRATPRPQAERKVVAVALPIRDPRGGVSVRGILAALNRAESEANRLRTADETAKAEQLESELKSLRLQLAGRKDAEASGKAELHAVGYHASQHCTVHVTDTSHPIVLALMAYQPTKWTVTADPGVNLQRVIVSGYHRQTLASAPAGVPTDVSSHDDGQPYFYFTGFTDRESPRHQAGLREKAGMDFSTFVGAEVYETQSVVIGRENVAWQLQRVARKIESLTAELDVRERTTALEALEALTFTNIYPGDVAEGPGGPRGAGGGNQIATYTLRGPILETVKAIPTSGGEPFFDKSDGAWYEWRGNRELVRFAPGAAAETIPFGADVPRLSWPHGLAFDTKRRRFVLNSFGGGGHVYAYDIVNNKWSVLRSPGVGISALTYSAERDLLYVFNNEQGDTISTYSPDGARIGFVKLSADVTRGGGLGRPDDATRIKTVGRFVAIITPGSISQDGRRRRLPRIALADPETGEVLYRGVMRPQAAARKISAEQLDALWTELLDADKDAADALVWKIAAGRGRAIEYLSERIGKTAPPDAAEVDKLVAELDSDKFESRQQAFRRLASFGAAAEESLKKAADSPSAEVRARVKDLLEMIAKDEPATGEQRREYHAIAALARIGTPDAVEVLSRIANRRPADSLSRRAAKSIENLGREEEVIEVKETPSDDPRARIRRGLRVEF
ncbi:MAG: HEAT repeat domain-containing protein [Pirellulales bacterium]